MTDEAIHHALQDIGSIVVIVTIATATVVVLKAIISAFRSRAVLRAQAALHNKILDKFGTAEEFTAYLQSDTGKTFFDNLSKEPATPLAKILASIQKGAILTLLGIGVFIISGVFGTSDSQNIMFIVGTVAVTVGVGFLVSSFISYRLAKSWGIISTGNQAAAPAPAPKTIEP